MTWLASNTPSGTVHEGNVDLSNSAELPMCQGSVVSEFQPNPHKPAKLVHYRNENPWYRSFSIFHNADGSISIESCQGPDRTYANLTGFGANCIAPKRISFTWDAPRGSGQFAAENLNTGSIQHIVVNRPIAIPIKEGLKAIGIDKNSNVDPSVNFLALADHVVSIGPTATIHPTTAVLTANGERQICKLRPGDRVVTKSNGLLPIRHLIQQTLPANGSSSPIHLRAPFFGLSQDVIVAANQRLAVAGIEAEYDFGNEAMFMEAGELVGLPGAAFQSGQEFVEYYQILLDSHEAIKISGAWTESLFIGALAKSPSIASATVLSDIPVSALPLHSKRACPPLRNFERRALFGAMIA